jgi:hypothetical protein
MTNWARSGGGDDDLARAALGAFVSALGGATRAAANATAGVRAAGGLGEFFADVSRDGLDTTLERYGLEDLLGGEPLEVLNEIAARVAGAGQTQEEAIAREAVLDVLVEIYGDAEVFADMEALEIDATAIRDFLARFLTDYIYKLVLHDLGDRITDNAGSPEEAARLEQQIREEIRSLVALDLSTIDPLNFDWSGPVGQERMRSLLADAFQMISAGE